MKNSERPKRPAADPKAYDFIHTAVPELHRGGVGGAEEGMSAMTDTENEAEYEGLQSRASWITRSTDQRRF